MAQGGHTFAVEAQDSAGNQSGAASFTWTIITTPPPAPVITTTPANPTNQTSASFTFSDTQSGVSFLCQLDGNAFSACASPQTYDGMAQGGHTFAVEAQDGAGNQSSAATFNWTITTAAPVAFNQNVTTAENTSIAINAHCNVTEWISTHLYNVNRPDAWHADGQRAESDVHTECRLPRRRFVYL
jgi:hypothetical protein